MDETKRFFTVLLASMLSLMCKSKTTFTFACTAATVDDDVSIPDQICQRNPND